MKKYVSKSANRTVKASKSIKASSGMSVEEMWDALIEIGVSGQTIDVVTSINGYSEETMCDILYVITGYRDFDQLEEE